MSKKKGIRIKQMVQGTLFDQTFDSQKEADVFVSLLETLKVGHLGSNQHQKQVSLAKAWCAVIEEKRDVDELDPETIKAISSPLRLFGPLLMKNVMEISPEDFVGVFANATNVHTGKMLAMRSLEGYALTLKAVLTKASELGAKDIDVKKIYKKVMKVVKSLGVPEKKYTSYTPDEVDQLVNSEETLAPWVRLFERASLASFKRLGELLALGWLDLDFETRKIIINKQITGGNFKWGLKLGSPAHYVDMDDELYEVFTKLKKWQEENGIVSDWVFASTTKKNVKAFSAKTKCPYKGKPLSRMTVINEVKKDMVKAGVPTKKIHDLRRTAATLFYLKSDHNFKTTMLVLQGKLNHSSLGTTEKYISASSEYLLSRMNVVTNSKKIQELEEKAKILELELKVRRLEEELKKAA